MKKEKINRLVILAVILVISSFILYLIHFYFFKDLHHILIYLLGDIAYIPIEVLFVTLIIHGLMEYREKRNKLKKLNMVIGAFFSEVGNFLLKFFNSVIQSNEMLINKLNINNKWNKKKFQDAIFFLNHYDFKVDVSKKYLTGLKKQLIAKRSFLLRLLENPNLLEHDDFTDLLWAVFHLTEELDQRNNLLISPQTDIEHLKGDLLRICRFLLREWVLYMSHLKEDYPYLFSLAVRISIFNPDASVLIK